LVGEPAELIAAFLFKQKNEHQFTSVVNVQGSYSTFGSGCTYVGKLVLQSAYRFVSSNMVF
jgi:hypothetical protein